jgi:TetR/AcrR family transcriptional regulator
MHQPAVTALKRSRNASRTREAILDAAEQLFAERGPEATSFQAIGAAAGVSRGTPGYFFGSKEALYRAVFDRAFTRVDAILAEAYSKAETAEPREALAGIVSAYLSIPPVIVRLGEREALRGGQTIQDLEPRLTQLRSSLDRLDAMTGERLKNVPAPLLLITIVALAWYPVAQSNTMLVALGIDIDDPEFRKDYTRFVTDTLLYGLAQNGDAAEIQTKRAT